MVYVPSSSKVNSSILMLSIANPAEPALPFTPSSLDKNLHVKVTSEPDKEVHSSLHSKVLSLV